MVMAHQVQQTMHPQMDKVIIEGFVVACGFGPDCLECDGDLAGSKAALSVSLGLTTWKGQDIGWLVLAPKLPVQAGDPAIVTEQPANVQGRQIKDGAGRISGRTQLFAGGVNRK